MPTNQSWPLKNGCAQAATWSRPVAARDSRTAAAVASEAFLVNFTISAPATVRDEVLGRVELHRGGPGEPDAAADRRAHGLDHRLVAVPQRDGPHAGAVLDEPVAVGVTHPRPAAVDDHRGHALGELVGAAREGVRPTGHQFVQALLQCRRTLERRESHGQLLVMIKKAVSG